MLSKHTNVCVCVGTLARVTSNAKRGDTRLIVDDNRKLGGVGHEVLLELRDTSGQGPMKNYFYGNQKLESTNTVHIVFVFACVIFRNFLKIFFSHLLANGNDTRLCRSYQTIDRHQYNRSRTAAALRCADELDATIEASAQKD
jgi:hypothetical protein